MVVEVPAPKPFSVSTDPPTVGTRWKKWLEGFEIYLEAANISKDGQKRALLLHIGGEELKEIFDTLKVENNSLSSAINALNEYFLPLKNKFYERYLFRQCHQEPSESLDAYVTRLRKLVKNYEHADTKELLQQECIIDQIIEKGHSRELRKKLLQEKNLTLEKVQDIARALEAANMQSNVIENKKSETPQVSKVVSNNHNQKGGHKKYYERKEGQSQHRPHQQVQHKPSQHTQGRYMQNYGHTPYKPHYVGNTETNTGKPRGYNGGPGYRGYNGGSGYKGGACFRCGNKGHYGNEYEKCPASGKTCSNCNKKGHFPNRCNFPKSTKQVSAYPEHDVRSSYHENTEYRSPTQAHEFAFQINSLNQAGDKRVMVDVKINNIPITMQIDTAADVTLISEIDAQNIPNLVVKKCNTLLRDYNNENISIVGSAEVNVQYGQQRVQNLPIIIVKGNRQTLLGLNWIKWIKLDWHKIFEITEQDKGSEISLNGLLSQFPTAFEDKVGTVKNAKAKLILKPDAVPKFCTPRPVPYALKTAVEMEIQRLENEGAWEKVTYSEWATPLVPIMKENGRVRLCGDYKVTVNPNLQVAQHPLPNPKDMFAALAGCTVFSKLDLRQAFQQLEMDKQSQELCTVNTSLGLYRPKRLPYGVASSPAIWQQTMDKIFAGIPGVFCFIDDILVAGKNAKEHQDRLKLVLQRILENGIKIQRNKCVFQVSSVEYLGFFIDGKGVHKANEKVRTVQSAKVPENVKELQSFLGLVTFYGSFIQDLARIAHPLYQLLSKEVRWYWSRECQESFEKIKLAITSPTFLVHYQMDLPVKLICDASSIGIGAVLAHEMPDGTEKPIAFASRVLNKAEQNYSQIEKEGLALVYGVRKFHMYLYGRKKFKLVTDH